ncbi:MAG: hypothetical protein HYY86_01900 [Candidatus Harrisonbacteria bacterium]|nr:hypothetical protein [Candidatus Harrisonbacteria bacterium]
MQKEERGVISNRVFKIGIAIAIALMIIGGLSESIHYFVRKFNSPPRPSGDSLPSIKSSRLPICEGTKNARLSRKDNSVRQLQNWNCLSELMVLPSDLAMGSLRYSFPGTTEIYECKRENNQDCFLVKEVTAKDAGRPIVFPTRMRLRGDPGEARFKLVK